MCCKFTMVSMCASVEHPSAVVTYQLPVISPSIGSHECDGVRHATSEIDLLPLDGHKAESCKQSAAGT